MKLPSFKQNNKSPKLEHGNEGVAILVYKQQSELILSGICRASHKTVEILADTILHNVAIICTYGPNLQPLIFSVVRDQVLFPDDIDTADNYHTAYFNINLNDYGIPDNHEQYFIFASFYLFLSETLIINGWK